MRLIIALAALAIPLASSPAHGPAATPTASPARSEALPLGGPGCRRPDLHPADAINKGKFNRLGELPPAQLVLTVVREVDGCQEPVIVGQRYGFGSPLPRARRW